MSGDMLAPLAHADRLLAEYTEPADLLNLRDMAEQARVFARQAKLGTSAINHATVIKLRAERKVADAVDAGQNSGRIAKPGGDRDSILRTPDNRMSLADVGVTAQRLAEFRTVRDRFTDDDLVALEQQATVADRLLSRDKIVRQAGWELRAQEQGRYADTAELDAADVLYVDPPWRYAARLDEADAVENHYPTMTDDAICAMRVPARETAVLFMWAVAPKAHDAFRVLDAWGFEYKTQMVWDKGRTGMGYYVRGQHELLYIATRGTPALPAPGDRPPSVIRAPYGGHSVKPPEVYDLIDRMYPHASKRELFARNRRDGWLEPWGLDAPEVPS